MPWTRAKNILHRFFYGDKIFENSLKIEGIH